MSQCESVVQATEELLIVMGVFMAAMVAIISMFTGAGIVFAMVADLSKLVGKRFVAFLVLILSRCVRAAILEVLFV